MNCRKVKKNLVLFLDGELPPSEAAFVRGHLEVCEACRKEAELLRSTFDLAVQRAREKTAPPPPEDYVSLFWQRELDERAGRESVASGASQRVPQKTRWPFGGVMRTRYAIGAVSVIVVAAAVLSILLQDGKQPSKVRLSSPGKEVGPEVPAIVTHQPTPVIVAADPFAQIEKQLEELEAAVRKLKVPALRTASFTGEEMQEVYASIGLAAANNYRDILKMNDVAAKRYAQVARIYPETPAGREAQQILSRLN